MEPYTDPNCCCCDPAPVADPVVIPEPAPLPAYVPEPVAPPAAEIFPEPAAPAPSFTPAPEPMPAPMPAPVVAAPLDAGTLLGPSVVGGGSDLGGGFVGGAPDLSAGGFVGGTPDLGTSGFVGGTPDLGTSGFVGGTPDLGTSGFVGGTTVPDLGGTWLDDNGTAVPAPEIPVVPGPFNAAAANIVSANNAAIAGGWLTGASTPSPAYWTPGFDSDHDGILNEYDPRPRDAFAR